MRAEFIDPGQFRTELIVEDVIAAGDGAGGRIETWVEIASVFGRLEPVRATPRFGADQRFADVTHWITIRHRGDVQRRMRFRKGDRVFAIETVSDPDETGRYLVCTTREDGR